MNIACIIPARGGSKGIPGKNIKMLAGKPLINWSIEQALESKWITGGVYVSSDCQEILQVAARAGAIPIRRPELLACDTASSESALIHAIDAIEQDSRPDYLVFLQCTSPIRQRDDIDNAIETVITQDADSLLSVLKIKDYFVWQESNELNCSASSVNFDYTDRKRRQELQTRYLENGSIYVFKPDVLQRFNNRLGGKIALYPMEKFCSQQIDDEAEFLLCESILKGLSQESGVLV